MQAAGQRGDEEESCFNGGAGGVNVGAANTIYLISNGVISNTKLGVKIPFVSNYMPVTLTTFTLPTSPASWERRRGGEAARRRGGEAARRRGEAARQRGADVRLALWEKYDICAG